MSGFDKYLQEQEEKKELEILTKEIVEFGAYVLWEEDTVILDGHLTLVELQKLTRAMELSQKLK